MPSSSSLDIARNREAVKYRPSELVRRILWTLGAWLFRLSPRPCFGFRRWLLRCFGAKIGKHVNIYPSATIYFPWNFEVGDYSAIGEWAMVYNLGKVSLGRQVTLSQRSHLCAGTHDYKDPAMPLLKPPIRVEDDAWICADAYVGPNVVVGCSAIVGARAVVVKNVEPNTIVAGNPAKVIGYRSVSEAN